MKAKRWLAVFDNHGDMADASSCAALWEFIKIYKPEIRIHGGDAFDLRCLRKKADEKERNESMQADVEAGIDFIRRLKPNVWLRGNHDERLWDLATNGNGNMRQFAGLLIDSVMDQIGDGVEVKPYNKREGVHKLGHLKIIHGYHCGITSARQAGLIWGNVAMGHVHRFSTAPIPGLERRNGRTVGCLCKTDMDYNRASANTLDHENGWLYGLTFPGGDYVAWEARRFADRWIFPSEFAEVQS
jgi:hypothetical protein